MGQPGTRSHTELDVLVTDKEELVGDVVISCRLGCSHHEMVGCDILRGMRKESSRG